MANFNTHLSTAIISSGMLTWTLQAHSVLSAEAIVPAILVGVLGGLIPDIDSDTSKPLFLFFNGLSFLIASIVLLFTFELFAWQQLAYLYIGIFVFFRYIVIRFFMYFTVHRGIFHSIPIALLMGILIAIGCTKLGCSDNLAWAYAVLFSSGYLIHLCLDEVFSFNLRGVKFKRSFGTALKLFSFKNSFQYAVLYFLLYAAYRISPNHESFIANFL